MNMDDVDKSVEITREAREELEKGNEDKAWEIAKTDILLDKVITKEIWLNYFKNRPLVTRHHRH